MPTVSLTPQEPARARFAVRDRSRAMTVLVGLVVLGSFGLLLRTFVDGYDNVRPALAGASWELLAAALAVSLLAMGGLALVWRATLAAFGHDRGIADVLVWYFAGEMGKYLPGGVWTVVGRGEIAARRGVERSTAYLTVAVSLLVTTVAGVCAVAALSLTVGESLRWVRWCAPPLGLVSLVCLHPRIVGLFGAAARAVTRGRIDLAPQRWSTMLRLTVLTVPVWAAIGVGTWTVAAALHLDGSPTRIALAAIGAWVAGMAAVPVPAGAGVRELIFVQASGLDAGPAALLAIASRLMYLVVDGVCGAVSLHLMRARSGPVDLRADTW